MEAYEPRRVYFLARGTRGTVEADTPATGAFTLMGRPLCLGLFPCFLRPAGARGDRRQAAGDGTGSELRRERTGAPGRAPWLLCAALSIGAISAAHAQAPHHPLLGGRGLRRGERGGTKPALPQRSCLRVFNWKLAGKCWRKAAKRRLHVGSIVPHATDLHVPWPV